jgi:hypothetical protein
MNFSQCSHFLPIPVALRSKAYVGEPSIPGIAGSSSAEAWIFLSCV